MTSKYQLVVGLGNPSTKYEKNRHNLGFILLDNYLKGKAEWSLNKKFNAEVTLYNEIVYAKPLTFMNESGDSVHSILSFYKIPIEKTLIIHDEIDLPFGNTKVAFGSSDAGHRGVRDIIKKLGTKAFYRLRFGVGRPEGFTPVDDYVLSDFSDQELQEILKINLENYLK